MPWVSAGMAALGVLSKENRPTEKAFTPRNCVNCGAPDEGYTNCRYCTTRMRMGAEEAIERPHMAKASIADESQSLRESIVTATVSAADANVAEWRRQYALKRRSKGTPAWPP